MGPRGTECGWYGVTCYSNGQAVYLNLRENGLDGQIPEEIGDLERLERLDLSRNQLTGPLPSGIGDLSALKQLNLVENRLSGALPDAIGRLGALEYLDLGSNALSGSLNPEVGSLRKLVRLDLRSNELSGTIPDSLGRLLSLTTLYLDHNRFSGPIPAGLRGLGSLATLYLSNNQLSGPLPGWVDQLPELWLLAVSDNQLSGPLPAELGTAPALKELYAYRNRFEGPIPPGLGRSPGLRSLYLWDNELSGPLPEELCDLSTLTMLNLERNQLTGPIPSCVGQLGSIRQLYLTSNRLTGEIPTSLTALANLDDGRLDLRWNGLHTDNAALRAFLATKQRFGDWESTQTLAPTGLRVEAVSPSSLTLSWAAAAYQNETGGYRSSVAASPEAPLAGCGRTAAKTDTGMTVTGLEPDTTYRVVVQSVTGPHADNPNTVVSEPGEEILAATAAGPRTTGFAGVARAPGQNQTRWSSGAVLWAQADTTLDLELIPRGATEVSAEVTRQLAAGGVAVVDDVYSELGAADGVALYAGVARTPGQNNTMWGSQAWLANLTGDPQTVLLELLERGTGAVVAAQSLTLSPGQLDVLEEVYADLGAVGEGAATLRLTGRVAAWVRTANQGAAGSFGQDLVRATAADAFAPSEVVVVPVETAASVADDFRSNLVLQNLEGRDLTVTVRSGSRQSATTVLAGAYVQLSNVGQWLGLAPGTAVLEVTADGRWSGSVSTVDPATGDPTTVRGAPASGR